MLLKIDGKQILIQFFTILENSTIIEYNIPLKIVCQTSHII